MKILDKFKNCIYTDCLINIHQLTKSLSDQSDIDQFLNINTFNSNQ